MLFTNCEDKMDQLQVLRLPSMAKFNAGFLTCNETFQQQCVGPSKASYENRMMKVVFHVLCCSTLDVIFRVQFGFISLIYLMFQRSLLSIITCEIYTCR